MTLRNKKKISIALYLLYAIFVTLFITYGTKVASEVKAVVQAILDRAEITDVTVSVSEDDVLMAGKYHYVTYTSYGDIRGDDGLEFESLDPEHLTVSGVEDVERFDENTIVLSTTQGMMTVTGENLHIEKLSLDGGDLKVEGEIEALAYEEERGSQGGFFARLLR